MGRWALGLICVTILAAPGAAAECAPRAVQETVTKKTADWGAERSLAVLADAARFRSVYNELHARTRELEPDHLACALARRAVARLKTFSSVRDVIEAYRSQPSPAEVSMVLMGVFRQLPDRLLLQVVDQYQAAACRTPDPGPFDLRVAADALASASEKTRIRFIESVLKLYGPGSSVYYKTEANDCLVIVDRELAYAALGTLPEEDRERYKGRFEIFHH